MPVFTKVYRSPTLLALNWLGLFTENPHSDRPSNWVSSPKYLGYGSGCLLTQRHSGIGDEPKVT
jgi:hypothetical protein